MRTRLGMLGVAAALLALVGLIALQTVASADVRKRTARLSGDKEVPGPGDPDGKGAATLRVNDEMGKVCFTIKWSDIGAPNAAHIHEGDSSTAGGVVVTLFSGQIPDTIHKVSGCAEGQDPTLLNDIQKNPRDYYVNVHNTEFPGGAIRGQLKKSKN